MARKSGGFDRALADFWKDFERIGQKRKTRRR
jgi:hypothetical protein